MGNCVWLTTSRGSHSYVQYVWLQPGLVTLYIAEMGVAHCVALYTTEKSQTESREVFPVRLCGHSQISAVITLVTAVRIAHIGVTTPCYLY